MGKCKICHANSPLISNRLGVCLECIRKNAEKALNITDQVHARTRADFDLPPKPPNTQNGLLCGMCANDCKIGKGEKGFCGLVYNIEGKLARMGGTPQKGILEWYYDPLPTNCVSWWFCPGCTGAGYPKHAYHTHAENEYSNLAVFYGSCTLDCLFCQNWHYRNLATILKPAISAKNLAAKVNESVSCICFFGGDPSSQMPHALKTSQIALEKARQEKRILRICWETNGYWKKVFAKKAAELSLESGGNIKFDIKTWDENLNKALCGVSNKHTLENFKMIGEKYFQQRPELPVLSASTLLIPGYIDVKEVNNIAKFIADINPRIPYTLLAFYPQYIMNDLPTTSIKLAHDSRKAAQKHLKNVRIGNVHLLS